MTIGQYPEKHWKVIQTILELTGGNCGVAVTLHDVGSQAGGRHKSRQSLWWTDFLQDVASAGKSDLLMQWVDEHGTEWLTLEMPDGGDVGVSLSKVISRINKHWR